MRKANNTVNSAKTAPRLAAAGAALGLVASLAAVAGAQTQSPAAQSPAAQGARGPQVLEQVYACADKTDAAERLACYDAAVGALKTAQTKGDITAIDKAQAKELERESFGFNLPSLPKIAFPNLFGEGDQPQTAEVKGAITRVSGQGKPTFHLDNGQVWQSIDTDQNRNARTGAAVTVRRGLSGSFLMSVEAGGPAVRVRRVQ